MTKNQTQDRSRHDTSITERRLSVILLAVLALIAAVMLLVQGRYDQGAWREQSSAVPADDQDRRQSAPSRSSEADTATGLEPLSPAETYTSDTLSDKINGKADLYLSAGFRGLVTRRFALAADNRRWMERYVYDMGDLRNAYAVFSSQRRPNVQPVDLTDHAYLAGNGLFFVHGPYYVEIIAAEISPEIEAGLKALAGAFVASHDVRTEDLVELGLLPTGHRVAGSAKLTSRSAFGIQGLDGVFTAAYTAGQAGGLAFVSRRASPNDAEALAEKFHAFWLEFGGEAEAPPDDLQAARIVFILDNYEISMVQGDYLLGVHEATDLEFGLDLVKQLRRNIAGIDK